MTGRLARDRLWLAGGLADLAAFGFHAGALHVGALAEVQPILPVGLVVGLVISARVQHRPHRWPDWAAAVMVTAGTAMFVGMADPRGGVADPSARAWTVAFGCCIVPAGLLIVVAAAGPTRRRAVLLAAATGLLFGLTAAIAKPVLVAFSQGVGGALSGWPLYALTAVAATGFVTSQRAFQAAPLAVSLPILTIADPIVGTGLGLGLFREHLTLGGTRGTIAAAGLATMAIGACRLARHVDAPEVLAPADQRL
jgi:drug/metabolite transporter (DMT)-like permease